MLCKLHTSTWFYPKIKHGGFKGAINRCEKNSYNRKEVEIFYIYSIMDVTTYSLDAVRTIAGINEENATIYLVSLEKGALKTKKLTLKEIEEFSKAGIDVRVAEPLLL